MEENNINNITQDNKEIEKVLKENNKYRPIYTFGFIIALIFISIAYASLAINLGVKVNPGEVKGVEETTTTTTTTVPVDPDKPTTTTTTSSPNKPTPKPTKPVDPTPPVPPIIVPPPPIRDLNWQISFENVQEQIGSVTPTQFPTIDSTKTGISFEVFLRQPGQYYKFNVDIVNKGERDAKIYDVTKTILTPKQQKYLKYIVTYADGTEIKAGDVLNVNDRRTISVLIDFNIEVQQEDLPDGIDTVWLQYVIKYVEK